MATAGPSYPGTGADDDSVGTITWNNPTNIEAADGVYTEAPINAHADTHYLVATDFGFTIPDGSTISGVTLIINRYNSRATAYDVWDAVVSLLKAGTISGDNKADLVTAWPGSFASKSYGGVSNLWGLSLTSADINASNFGAVLQVHGHGASSYTARTRVDYITITVTYIEAGQPMMARGTLVPGMRQWQPSGPGRWFRRLGEDWQQRRSGLLAPTGV